MKRCLDLVVSCSILLILGLPMLVLALLVKLTSKGPVFFRGERVGQNGVPFRIFKFRSMVANAEGMGPWNVGDTDPRVTPLGRFLRTTKLDELPQFLNVLKGDMSLVGPRPELQVYIDMYTDREKPILTLRPGITDWASLAHSEQYAVFTSAVDPDKAYLQRIRPIKLELQLLYLQTKSLGTDVCILWWTFRHLVLRSKTLPADVQTVIERAREQVLQQEAAAEQAESAG